MLRVAALADVVPRDVGVEDGRGVHVGAHVARGAGDVAVPGRPVVSTEQGLQGAATLVAAGADPLQTP